MSVSTPVTPARSRAPWRRAAARISDSTLSVVGLLLKAAIVFFMVIPVVCIAVFSFGKEAELVFPPQGWGLQLYEQFFHSPYWVGAVFTSFKIGIPSALLAVVVGGMAVWAMSRAKVPFPNGMLLLGLAPIIIPAISYSIALYIIYLNFGLLYTNVGLILADAVQGIPFVLLILKAALDRIPAEFELVATSLGASRTRAVAGITLPLLRPALIGAFIFAFMASFDESTLVQFLGGPSQNTLPKAIFDSVRTSLSPVIQAVATTLVFGSGILIILGGRLRRGRALEGVSS